MAVNLNVRENLPGGTVIFDEHAYDNSIIGITFDGRAIYCYEFMIDELMNDEEWDEDQAIDWVDYNTVRSLAYAGERAPIIVSSIF